MGCPRRSRNNTFSTLCANAPINQGQVGAREARGPPVKSAAVSHTLRACPMYKEVEGGNVGKSLILHGYQVAIDGPLQY